jgi:hypothetical protein
MDLLTFEESFFFPRIEGFNKLVIGKGGSKVLSSDLFVVIVLPNAVGHKFVDGFSRPEHEDEAFSFFVSSKGISGKGRTQEIFVLSQWVPSGVFFFTLFPLFCHTVRVTV